MRLKYIFLSLGIFTLAAVVSVLSAQLAARVVEDRSAVAVDDALTKATYDWADVQSDGLQVILSGEAPSEASRFRAISTAGTVVDASRVIDNLSVADASKIAPPKFTVEMLRNESGVSLIGLIPATTDREALIEQVTKDADGAQVADFLETADYPMSETWDEALKFGIESLAKLPRAKISVSADAVAIKAIGDSETQKRNIEADLSRSIPDDVRLSMNITAPRPVITPFTTRFIIDDDGTRFDACAADSVQARGKILSAARGLGLEGLADCTIGLGVPTPRWADAIATGMDALKQLGGGTITFADADVSLIALKGTPQSVFDRVVGDLENTLPDLFDVTALNPPVDDASEDGPPEFTATKSPEGSVQLRGRLTDELTTNAADNFSRARFGNDKVVLRTRLDPDLPKGWGVRVLAALDALGELSYGAVLVQPALIEVRGKTGNPDAKANVTRALNEKLGEGQSFTIDIVYEEKLDPVASLPTAEECVADIQAALTERKISFEPSSASLDVESRGTVDKIAETLRECPQDLRLEIAGYTDSQGRDVMNQQLSQQRADTVLTALRERRVITKNIKSVGYGEENPIADNETAEGREANRRIEFTWIKPEPIVEQPTGLEAIEDAATDPTPTEETPAAETTDEQN